MEKKKTIPVLPAIPNDSRLKLVKRITKLMDEEFSVGGFRFGWDPILNLFPVVGDVAGYAISVSLILTMLRHGASGKLVAKMMANASLDALIGLVPFLGWIADFVFKANTRNVKLLVEHYTAGKHQGSARPVVYSILITGMIIAVVIVFLSFIALRWLVRYGDKLIGVTF